MVRRPVMDTDDWLVFYWRSCFRGNAEEHVLFEQLGRGRCTAAGPGASTAPTSHEDLPQASLETGGNP